MRPQPCSRPPSAISPRVLAAVRSREGWSWLGVAAALALTGCVTDAAQRGQAAREQARPPLDLTGDAPWPAAYDSDPLWRRAASGGDFERARLAQRESAVSLLTALSLGGSLGRTALAALPYASDRAEVIGPLCELALGPGVPPSAPTSGWLLDTLLDAIAHAPRTAELVDPAAEARCASGLRQLAEHGGSSAEDRDRALGALSLLAPR